MADLIANAHTEIPANATVIEKTTAKAKDRKTETKEEHTEAESAALAVSVISSAATAVK